MVSNENEAETIFFLYTLKKWLTKQVRFITIDFSTQLESGVNKVFPQVHIQKCIFHSIHLFIKAFLKELNRLKKERFSHRIHEWNALQRRSRVLETKKDTEDVEKCKLELEYEDITYAWDIYRTFRKIFSKHTPHRIEYELKTFLSMPHFIKWGGNAVFMDRYRKIFTNRALHFTKKGVNYISTETYRAWRAAIRSLRKEEETLKACFNDIKYLMLMNLLNMKSTHKKLLRNSLKKLPWLRVYRKLIVNYYYHFRLPPEKRKSLSFLSQFITSDATHERLKSAVQTLVKNEDKIFRFQHLPYTYASKKSIKVVDESSNRLIQKLFFVQHGMRTLNNIRMRISKRLKCPIIVSPPMIEKYNTSST